MNDPFGVTTDLGAASTGSVHRPIDSLWAGRSGAAAEHGEVLR